MSERSDAAPDVLSTARGTTSAGERRRADHGRHSDRSSAMFLRAALVAVAGAAFSGLVMFAAFHEIARSVATTRALARARRLGEIDTRTIFAPYITDALLAGDLAAAADLDRVTHRYLAASGAVRVKVWSSDARVAYSDEPRLVGRQFTLEAEEWAAFASGRSKAEFSDLSRPENEYERPLGRVLEVYVPVSTASGAHLLIETYYPFALVEESARDLRRHYLPVIGGAIAALSLVQLPVSLGVALRLQRAQRARARLLARLLAVSDTERRRIAGEIHDGAVQDLVGLGFSLGAAVQRADDCEAGPLREVSAGLSSVTERLRHLLTTVYPIPVGTGDVRHGVEHAAAPLRADGIAVAVEVDEAHARRLSGDHEAIVLRTISELLRNVHVHSRATSAAVHLFADASGGTVVSVADDGIGMNSESAAHTTGHFGLRLLHDLASDAGGALRIGPASSASGVVVSLTLPRPR